MVPVGFELRRANDKRPRLAVAPPGELTQDAQPLPSLAQAHRVTEHRAPVAFQHGQAAAHGLRLEARQQRRDILRQPQVQKASVGGVQRLDEHVPGAVAASE